MISLKCMVEILFYQRFFNKTMGEEGFSLSWVKGPRFQNPCRQKDLNPRGHL